MAICGHTLKLSFMKQELDSNCVLQQVHFGMGATWKSLENTEKKASNAEWLVVCCFLPPGRWKSWSRQWSGLVTISWVLPLPLFKKSWPTNSQTIRKNTQKMQKNATKIRGNDGYSSDVHMSYDFDINGAQRMSQPGGLVVPSMAIHNHQLEWACLQNSYIQLYKRFQVTQAPTCSS